MLFKHIFFMRVLFSKIHCPSFICFCKPSLHLYTPGPPKLENTPHVSSTCASAPVASDLCGESQTTEVKEGNLDGNQQGERILKSSLKKVLSGTGAPKEVGKKRVQWMDNFGKELLEVMEFEASEVEDSDNEGENRGCLCIIL